MKRNVLVVCLSLLAAACGGGGRSSLSSCEALAKCCDSLPSTSAGSCGALASATDQAACDASLTSLQAASYCKGITTSHGPTGDTKGGGCDQYLACLLVAQPQAYAAALPLYGKGSACWATSAQSAGCTQACDAGFTAIASACECNGSSCTACHAPSGLYYESGSQSQGHSQDCFHDDFELSSLRVDSDGDHVGRVALNVSGLYTSEAQPMLSGPLSCTGASTFSTSSTDSYGCTIAWSVVLTPASSADSVQVKATRTQSCPNEGSTVCMRSSVFKH